MVKSWVGITTTQYYDDLDVDSLFSGSHNTIFSNGFMFARQCEIFTSRQAAFSTMAPKITSEQSTYVFETPYTKDILLQLIEAEQINYCLIQALNVSDVERYGVQSNKIRTYKNPNFKFQDIKVTPVSSIGSNN